MNFGYNPPTHTVKILEENNYYPFGLQHKNYNVTVKDYIPDEGDSVYIGDLIAGSYKYKYKYNGKELQDELGLNMTAMDYRQYDNAIGRFVVMDRLSEMTYPLTPYRFTFNNPIVFTDTSGLSEQGGNQIMGWINNGDSIFWDPNVNNQTDVDRLYGSGYKYLPDNTEVIDAKGNKKQLNSDGTTITILDLDEVVINVKRVEKTAIDYFSLLKHNYNGLNDILIGGGLTQLQKGYNNNYGLINQQYYNFYKANKGNLNIPKPSQQRQILKK